MGDVSPHIGAILSDSGSQILANERRKFYDVQLTDNQRIARQICDSFANLSVYPTDNVNVMNPAGFKLLPNQATRTVSLSVLRLVASMLHGVAASTRNATEMLGNTRK